MPSHLLFASLVTVPATALFAAGVLGALGIALHPRRQPRIAANRTWPAHPTIDAAPGAQDSRVDAVLVLRGMEADHALGAAQRFLEDWADKPRSAWRELALRELRARRSADAAGARAAAQELLARVLGSHVPPFDAWQVADFAETAWHMAPDDGARLAPDEARLAREVVRNTALALTAGTWLPVTDFGVLVEPAVL